MLLFFLSVIMVFATSFFVTVVLENKKFCVALIYFLLAAFANVVITFEILSLFSAISKTGVLAFNVLFLVISTYFWNKYKRPHFDFKIKDSLKLLSRALIKDKYLLVLSLCSVFMCVVSLWLISFMPVVNPDAEGYHVLRSLFWISNKNLNHFNIADIRCLDLPINSEILYAWIILFVKKSVWFGIFSFMGFVLSMTALFGVLSNIGLSLRKKLWVILITSSFASVIVQASGTETDIIISGLVLSSIFLFWNALKTDKKLPMFMSALSYALAVGTKTPALILVPAVGLWMCAMSIYYKKKMFYKPLLLFFGFAILNFFLFGAYNYILNFIEYGNIAGSASLLSVHRNHSGLKSVPADFIRYIFMFFDFTGFKWHETLGVHIINFRDSLLNNLSFLYVQDGLYSSDTSVSNNTLLEPLMGLGILGFLVYLPCLFYSLIRPFLTKCKKDWMIFSFAVIFIISLITMSIEIQFMTYSVRFFASFAVIGAPILAYSYIKKNNVAKFIVVSFAVFYLTLVSTSLWARSAVRIFKYFKQGATVSQVREIATCSGFYKNIKDNPSYITDYPILNVSCGIRDLIKMLDKRNKILYFSNSTDTILIIKMLEYEGYNIDFDLAENINNIDLSKYNLIINENDIQLSTNVKQYENRNKKNMYLANGIICKYLDLDEKPIQNDSKNYPYKSVCKFSNYFYKNNGYKFYTDLIINYTKIDKTKVIKYNLYENINNPIINRVSPSN